jgi:hypothetical protein
VVWVDEHQWDSVIDGVSVSASFDSSVLNDIHEPDEQFRYKMVLSKTVPVDEPGLFYSRDGIAWKAAKDVKLPGFADTIPALYHDSAGKGYDFLTRQQW